MSEIIALVLGIWFGALIVIMFYGGNQIMLNREEKIIDIEKIKIKDDFKKHKPRYKKLKSREIYFLKNNEFYSPIILNKDNVLIDGYTSYLIAKKLNFKQVEFIRG